MIRSRDVKKHGDCYDAYGRDDPEQNGETRKGRAWVEAGRSCFEPDDISPSSRRGDEQAEDLYDRALAYCRDTFRKMFVSWDEGYRIIRSIVNAYVADSIYIRALHSEEEPDFVIRHSVNVAVYSIKLGEELGFGEEEQVKIGTAGLLHDVGKCLIRDGILYKKGPLTDQELRIVRYAPDFGYELLKSLGPEHAYLAECCLQVHERIDGSGYPKGLKGDSIHQYAQIIGLVDIYEALTHTRPYRERLPHFEAVKEIVTSGKHSFQKKYLKALLRSLSFFPLYSYVKLNSLAIGRVIKTYRDQPLKPKIEIIRDSQGRRTLNEQVVNLSENPLLYVVESVSEEQLQALCFLKNEMISTQHPENPFHTPKSALRGFSCN